MAGDWIKMRVCLWTHPKVVTLSSQLSVTRAHAIGALHCAWSIADQHADHYGNVIMPTSALDSLAETPGLAAAMQEVGWLKVNGPTLQFIDYQQHNGTTGKQRADAQKRQRASRSRHGSVTVLSQKTVTREEKRREEKNKEEETIVSSSCPEPAKTPDSGPSVMDFPTVGTGPHVWSLSEAKLREYGESFPGIDVWSELRKALQWLRDNPAKRKTAKGMSRFLGSWLGRAQDSKGGRRDTERSRPGRAEAPAGKYDHLDALVNGQAAANGGGAT